MNSGDTIGKYRLLRSLGRGGMGEAWLATANGHGGFVKNVVLKTLLPELADDPLFVDMLAHEARIGAKLSHPNLIEVFDFIEHKGRHLLAMEYVVGRPLSHVLQAAKLRKQPIPLGVALRVALDCCRGLEYAHDQGIIHCDLSPSNVMLTAAGIAKVLDFGVAHASAQGPRSDRLKGKFSYMAPERIDSLATDRRTDVYSLGVMLYLLLTGRLPFVADNDAKLFRRILAGSPPPPSTFCEIDPRVEELVLCALQLEPSARHQSMREVLASLEPCAQVLGAYSHDAMITYLKALFGPRAETEEPITLDAGTVDLDSLDIEVEFPDAVPNEPRTLGELLEPRAGELSRGLPTVFGAGVRSSSFGAGSETREPKTSVQSLFERPAVGAGKLFSPIDDDERPLERPFGPASAPALDFALDPALDPLRAPARGGFGNYSSTSRSGEPAAVAWPWPNSRVRS